MQCSIAALLSRLENEGVLGLLPSLPKENDYQHETLPGGCRISNLQGKAFEATARCTS